MRTVGPRPSVCLEARGASQANSRGLTIGREIRKTHPCLVVSPDEMNHTIRTSIVAPMTTKGHGYPTRISCRFAGKTGQIVLDQIRTVDQGRLVKKLGRIDAPTSQRVLDVLEEMFAR